MADQRLVGTSSVHRHPCSSLRRLSTGRIGREEADRLVELTDDPAAKPGDAGAPLGIALGERRPAYAQRLMLRRSDRVRLQIEVTAFPLIGQEGKVLGAVVMFWERPGP